MYQNLFKQKKEKKNLKKLKSVFELKIKNCMIVRKEQYCSLKLISGYQLIRLFEGEKEK